MKVEYKSLKYLILFCNIFKDIFYCVLIYIFEKRYKFWVASLIVSKEKNNLEECDNVIEKENIIINDKEILESNNSFIDSIYNFITMHPVLCVCILFGSVVIVYFGYTNFIDNPYVLDISTYSAEVQHYLQIPFERWNALMLHKVYNELGEVTFGRFVNLDKIPSNQVDLFLTLKTSVSNEVMNEILASNPHWVVHNLSPELLEVVGSIINNL